MKVALLIKEGELSGFPANLYIEGKIFQADDIVRFLSDKGITILI
ncbi:hypothetical protein [Caminibacter sp.]